MSKRRGTDLSVMAGAAMLLVILTGAPARAQPVGGDCPSLAAPGFVLFLKLKGKLYDTITNVTTKVKCDGLMTIAPSVSYGWARRFDLVVSEKCPAIMNDLLGDNVLTSIETEITKDGVVSKKQCAVVMVGLAALAEAGPFGSGSAIEKLDTNTAPPSIKKEKGALQVANLDVSFEATSFIGKYVAKP